MRPTEPAGSSERSAGGRVNQTGLARSEEHTSELQSQSNLVCRLLLEKKKKKLKYSNTRRKKNTQTPITPHANSCHTPDCLCLNDVVYATSVGCWQTGRRRAAILSIAL